MRNRASALVGIWHAFVASFQLLSRFPVPVQVPFEAKVLRVSVVFFPLVGFAIGSVLTGAGYAASILLPVLPAAAILTMLWAALTGGLHLDGLMDTADGILSHRSREQMLEIMKDSRSGAMGVIACVLQLLVKFALLTALLESEWKLGVGLLPIVLLWSRWSVTAAIATWPYARGEQGMGSRFQGVGMGLLVCCCLMAAILSVSTLLVLDGSLPGSVIVSLAALLVAASVSFAIGAWLNRKLGGLTGDTYGAINELVETGLLLAAVLYIYNFV